MNKEVKKLYRQKITAEITVIIGSIIVITTGIIYSQTSHVLFSGIGLVIGLLLVFFGVSNFSHLKETFKETFISNHLSEWMKGGDYYPHVGLSKIQVYGSDFFNPSEKYYSEALITGAVDNIPFLSSDLMLYTKKTDSLPFFSGRLFIFEFNTPLNIALLALQDKNKPIATKQYYYSEKFTRKLNGEYRVFSIKHPAVEKLFTQTFIEHMNALNRLHRDTINFSIKESKMYISFNDHTDTFALKFLRPLNKLQLRRFQKDVAVIRDLLNDIKHNEVLYEY